MPVPENPVYIKMMKEIKKGDLVRLSPDGLFDEPYIRDQFGIVISVSKRRRYGTDTAVWVWLQKDNTKVLIDVWDLDIMKKEEQS